MRYCVNGVNENWNTGVKKKRPCGADDMPPGPVAFHGAIVFERDFIANIDNDPKGEDKFKFVLAHELVHVFDFMRLLVPAFRNWKRFWKICMDKGCAMDVQQYFYR
jgi:Zn-dependent peptidase ImmA (M78 family)